MIFSYLKTFFFIFFAEMFFGLQKMSYFSALENAMCATALLEPMDVRETVASTVF